MSTVVLATYGKTKEHHHADLMAVLRYQFGMLVMETRGRAHIDLARSALAFGALAHGADVVVFIDHDILFDPLDVERLAGMARQTRGVVGAPYSARRMGGPVVGGPKPTEEHLVFYEGGGLHQVDQPIGMGFTAIHREAFERLHSDPKYALVSCEDGLLRWYFQKLIIDGHVFGEDGSFCHAVRQAGGTTHVDTSFRVKHLGEYAFRIEDARSTPQDEATLRLRVRAHQT